MKSIRRFASFVLPALMLGTAPAHAQALPDAEPAMWMVKDADTTIYLFGTFHALDGKADWFNDEVKQAFDASQEVVLEVITPDNPAELAPTIMKYAIDTSGTTLTSRLSPRGQKAFAAALARHGMPATALDKFRPFFASLTLTMLQFTKMGMGADQGSEAVIKRAMAGTNKKLGAVETVEQQLGMFAALSDAEQIRLLEASLKNDGAMAGEIKAMLDMWNRGDAAAVAKLIQQSDKDSPSLYKAMFTDRDARWVEWIDRRLDQPGTVFMAVGTGHLAGDRSVVGMLQKQGHDVTRVQ